jgi:hypothetical protein
MSAVLDRIEKITHHEPKPVVPTTNTAGGGNKIPPAFRTALGMHDNEPERFNMRDFSIKGLRLTGPVVPEVSKDSTPPLRDLGSHIFVFKIAPQKP